MVPGSGDNSGGSTLARSGERLGGLHIKTPHRPLRLDAQPTLISAPESAVGSIRGRCLGYQTNKATPGQITPMKTQNLDHMTNVDTSVTLKFR